MSTSQQDPARWLTMERQFCRACWAEGKRVKVFDLGDPRNQGGRDRSFTLRRRNAILRHLRAEHPVIADREFPR